MLSRAHLTRRSSGMLMAPRRLPRPTRHVVKFGHVLVLAALRRTLHKAFDMFLHRAVELDETCCRVRANCFRSVARSSSVHCFSFLQSWSAGISASFKLASLPVLLVRLVSCSTSLSQHQSRTGVRATRAATRDSLWNMLWWVATILAGVYSKSEESPYGEMRERRSVRCAPWGCRNVMLDSACVETRLQQRDR
jgi:hypothetical protein